MDEKYFNKQEITKILPLCRQLLLLTKDVALKGDFREIKNTIVNAIKEGHLLRSKYGINPVIHSLETAILLSDKVSPDRNMIIAILLHDLFKTDYFSADEVENKWGYDVAKLVKGLLKAFSLYRRQAAVESDNFRNLLLTFAEDIRVIIIMIVVFF